jgi:hypothetical protein
MKFRGIQVQAEESSHSEVKQNTHFLQQRIETRCEILSTRD